MSFYLLIENVQIGSLQHLCPIVITVFGSIWMIKFSKTKLDLSKQRKLIHYIALFMSSSVILFHIYKISLGGYSLSTDLPLYLCSFLALLMPIFTYYRKYWMFEILMFWIIAGTSQAVITPDISIGFPDLDYFRYWIVHLGLLVIIFYFIFVFKMKPTFKSVIKSFLALQVYVSVMIGVNYMLKANYSYLNAKPKSASILDYLGDWPDYIFVIQGIIIPLFLLIYLPFYWSNKKIKRTT